MSTRDAFADKFRMLLREIPENYTLSQWQFLYRQVIFSMGMRILEQFPMDATGPDPFVSPAKGNPKPPPQPPPPPPPPPIGPVKGGPMLPGGGTGGHGLGGQPSLVIAEVALGLEPAHGKDH
jgi:hypothetical protein